MIQPIQVHHEWGTLKEVVVGYPFLRVPQEIPAAIANYAAESSVQWMNQNKGKRLEEAEPELAALAREQVEAAIAILKERGIIVHQVKPWEPYEEEYLGNLLSGGVQFFPRDPILVIGNTYIETEPYLPCRRKERFAIRRALADRLDNSDARIVSMPPAAPLGEEENWGPGPFLEGGDVFLLGRDIYVGMTGNASNEAGIRWLQNCLGQEYRVHKVRLSKDFLHLDCVLATPRPGLALIHKEAFLDGLPDFLEGWQLIEVSHQDAEEKLGCNGMVLDEKTVLVARELPHIAEALERAGQEVITTPFDAVYKWSGAFRCWHHPLVRESELA